MTINDFTAYDYLYTMAFQVIGLRSGHLLEEEHSASRENIAFERQLLCLQDDLNRWQLQLFLEVLAISRRLLQGLIYEKIHF